MGLHGNGISIAQSIGKSKHVHGNPHPYYRWSGHLNIVCVMCLMFKPQGMYRSSLERSVKGNFQSMRVSPRIALKFLRPFCPCTGGTWVRGLGWSPPLDTVFLWVFPGRDPSLWAVGKTQLLGHTQAGSTHRPWAAPMPGGRAAHRVTSPNLPLHTQRPWSWRFTLFKE